MTGIHSAMPPNAVMASLVPNASAARSGTTTIVTASAVPATSAVHSSHALTRHQNQRSSRTAPVPLPTRMRNRNTVPTSLLTKLASAATAVISTVATRLTTTSWLSAAAGRKKRWYRSRTAYDAPQLTWVDTVLMN